jgi:hypothetical protein
MHSPSGRSRGGARSTTILTGKSTWSSGMWTTWRHWIATKEKSARFAPWSPSRTKIHRLGASPSTGRRSSDGEPPFFIVDHLSLEYALTQRLMGLPGSYYCSGSRCDSLHTISPSPIIAVETKVNSSSVFDDLRCDLIYFGAALFLEGFFFAFRLARLPGSPFRTGISCWDSRGRLEKRPGSFSCSPCCHIDRFKRERNTPTRISLPSRTTGNAGLTRVFDAAKSRSVAIVPQRDKLRPDHWGRCVRPWRPFPFG